MVQSHSRVLLLVVFTFSIHVERKQAANTGGSDHSNLLIVTTQPPLESTTLRPPLTTPGLFASSVLNNYTVQAGTKVTLHCQVDYLAENTSVSWLRRFGDSLTLVSVGTEVYSGDKRYTSGFSGRKDWQLHISGVNQTDQGYYECQLSSHPPIVRSIYLHVLVPVLEIADERSLPIKNKFYNSGSTIELKCVITKVPQPTQFIIWTHNSTILNYDTTRGGISVKTDILPDGAKSQLYINNVGPADSGNYTCSLGEAAVTSVSVVVITGETPAAMQHGRATSQVSAAALSMTAALLIRYVS